MSDPFQTGLMQDLQVQQRQGLIMTPALTQALQILAMPALELSQFVQEQLEENPVLETKEYSEEQQSGGQEERINYDETAVEEIWQRLLKAHSEEPGIYAPLLKEEGYKQVLRAPEEQQLPTFLRLQLATMAGSPAAKTAAEYLIEHLDENGYLALPLEQLSLSGGFSVEVAEQALTLLQSLEPTGVGARDLAECLALQIGPAEPQRDLVLRIITQHLDDLARNRVRDLARVLKVSVEAVEEAFARIRELNPRPAGFFAGGAQPVQYIVPDIFVTKAGDDYQVTLNENLEPKLQISSFYRHFATSSWQDPDAQEYMKQKLNAAINLIRNIEKRRDTVYRLAQIVVERQRGFLENGLPGLAPLTMKDVADQAELHESTVSRAIAGKYIQTPRGVFEWKFFFPRAYDTEQGQVAPAWVKSQLLELVEAEDKHKPFSDTQLQELLDQRGISVARRTVAKYREQLGIPARAIRRR